MLRVRFASRAIVLLALILSPGLACADSGAPMPEGVGLAVVDFTYLDTSGEPADQVAAHERRLGTFMAALRRDLSADGRFRLVTLFCGSTPCTVGGLAPADLLPAASDAGARILVIGGIHKLSTLVQWANVQAVDVAADRVLFDKLFTFRGDSDEAWTRAEAFVSRDVRAALEDLPAGAAAADRVKLAVFDLELEDVSPSASSTTAPSDVERLAQATNEVRRLFTQSARYRVIDIRTAESAVAEARALRDCGGCDAAIALKLGADQSFVGVVRRISRTEYVVRFQIRDARTGAVVAEGDSGLRMGADDSWGRGAVRLVKERLLETGSQP